MYTEAEKQELAMISEMLMDGQSRRHAERLIVDAVIQDCRDAGRTLEEAIKNFMAQGLKAPH